MYWDIWTPPESDKACFLCVVYVQGASKHHQNIQGSSKHVGVSKHMRVSKHIGQSKHMQGIQTYGGVDTYRGNSCMPSYPAKWVLPLVIYNTEVFSLLVSKITPFYENSDTIFIILCTFVFECNCEIHIQGTKSLSCHFCVAVTWCRLRNYTSWIDTTQTLFIHKLLLS